MKTRYVVEIKDIYADGCLHKAVPVKVYPPAPNNSHAFYAVPQDKIDAANEALSPKAAARRLAYLDYCEVSKFATLRKLEELILNQEYVEPVKASNSKGVQIEENGLLDIVR